ncbi:MAG: hypothetical protein VST70_02525 [Nitrospirota bacterium]|nr:hypothetical protein [Nitrospirota bacterium]
MFRTGPAVIPGSADIYRLHYVRATVRIHRHPDGSLSLFHGPWKLADYPFEEPVFRKSGNEPLSKAPSTRSDLSGLWSENGRTLSS